MRKIIIENYSDPKWHEMIEHKVDLTLSSINSSASSIRVSFESVCSSRDARSHYRCEVSGFLPNGKIETVSSLHPDGKTALQAAISRFKRNIIRTRRKPPGHAALLFNNTTRLQTG